MHFAIGDQLRVWMVIDRNIKLAQRVPRADARGRRARRDRRAVPRAHPQGHALPARAAAGPRLLPVAQAPRGDLRRTGDPGRGAAGPARGRRQPLRHCHVGGDRKVGHQWGRGPGSWGAGASRMCRFAACSWESTSAGRSPTPSSSTARRCTRRRRRRPRTTSRAGCWRRSRRRSSAPAPARTQVEGFAHGMTVGTNALLDRARRPHGAGRDRGLHRPARDRPPGPPAALPPVRAEAGAAGRRATTASRPPSGSGRDGRGRAELDRGASSTRVVAEARGLDAESVAICLLFSYLEPAHERAIAERLRAELPGVHVSASHEVLAQFREYERCSTTVIDAYLSPLLGRYLGRLGEAASERGLPEPAVMMSSGGVAPGGRGGARRRLERALGARRRRRRRRAARASSRATATRSGFDMGGTSCDVCVVEDGPRAAHRLARDRRPGDPAADGRRPHGRRRRRLDRLARRGRRAAGRARDRRAPSPDPPATGAAASEPTVTDANLAARLPERRLDASPAASSSTPRPPRRRSAGSPPSSGSSRWRQPRGSSGSRTRRWSGRCGWSRSSAGSTRGDSP